MLRIGAISFAALLLAGPLGSSVPPHRGNAPHIDCVGPLTGRTIGLPKGQSGFGSGQHLPQLPLNPGEYVLTFDDGPTPETTPKLLAILKSRCVEATFMMIGKKAAAHPELVHAVLDAGHGVGSHTWSHPNISTLTADALHKEVLDGVNAVEQAGWSRSRPDGALRLFRIPGATGVPAVPPEDFQNWLRQEHVVIAGVDASPEDWRNDPAPVSFKRLTSPGRLPASGVILMHDWPSNTLILLPMVLDELQRRGAKIVALRLRDGNQP